MIIKTSVRGNGGKLADYLLKDKKNDRAELLEMRGWTAATLKKAFSLSEEIAQQKTHCENPFYHVAFRAAPGETLTAEQWAHCAEKLESQLGLEGHHRAMVMHTYKGEKHLHVVWDRIDENTLKAAELKYEHLRCKDAARTLEKELGLQPVRNQKRDPERELAAPTMAEEQQARRKGQDLKDRREAIREAWERSTDGQSFTAALDERCFILAQGDKRDYVAIDRQGSVYSIGKRTTGATASQVRGKLADLDRDQIPTVKQAHALLQEREGREDRQAEAANPKDQAAHEPEREGPEAQTPEPTPQPARHAADRTKAPRVAAEPEPARERTERAEDTRSANPQDDRFRVFDPANGIESGVSAFAGKTLDYLATQAEGLIEGIAESFGSLFDGGSAARRPPAPEPARAEKAALERLYERAAKERALRNISKSVQRGDDLNAADLRALPRAELERIHEGGDEYLMRMVKRFERERDDRGRERER